jgi:MFS superfamily sulfate permease-like transporter
MDMMLVSAILGGLVVGFMAGASRVSTGGTVAAAVAALQLGMFGFLGGKEDDPRLDTTYVAGLFIAFLLCLLVAYVGANVARRKSGLVWMGISPG